MEELDQKITELESRIDRLVNTQIGFQTEISNLRAELKRLRESGRGPVKDLAGSASRVPPLPQTPKEPIPSVPPGRPPTRPAAVPPLPRPESLPQPVHPPPPFWGKYSESARADLEKFIGENLISKIGILVLIIGIGIGVKYSIDNNLISPLTRVILAYLLGFGLVGLAIKLKPKYLNFSSALMGGGLATIYFVTYFAYTAYGLLGQLPAFGMMVTCTLFTVVAALFYNRQVIAHIGLVGAYAVPFLLSSNSGNYLVLFIYMAILNAGILAISIRKYWRAIFYTASVFTWIIYAGWFASRYAPEENFAIALVFLGLFFGTFFATKLLHAAVHNEHDSKDLLFSVLPTAFIFYLFCFAAATGSISYEQTGVLFAFLAVFTAALLIVSLTFIGKPVVFLSFASTWMIFGSWYFGTSRPETRSGFSFIFASIFFAIFYAGAVIHRLANEKLNLAENSILVISNSLVFYGFGYSILNSFEATSRYLGLFTAAHSGFHLAVALLINRIRSAAVDVVQVLSVLVLTFASIAIPVQLDGNQVTMAWAVESAVLFWFGRARRVSLFELYSYPVMLLATGSMFFDWAVAYTNRTYDAGGYNLQPIANGNFVTALVYVAAFAAIYAIGRENAEGTLKGKSARTFNSAIVSLGLFVLYNALRLEISNYFHLQEVAAREGEAVSGPSAPYVNTVFYLNLVWQICFTLLYLAAIGFTNLFKVRSGALALANAALSAVALFATATLGMGLLYDLRVAYLAGQGGSGLVSIRYAVYASAAILIFSLYLYSRDKLLAAAETKGSATVAFESVAYSFWFIAASCELVNTMAQFGIPDGTKLGISIFWGIYALMLIVIGIAWNRKHLRVAAICLLAVTLVKLFFYDAADLDTIPRTILFVSLGLTLLVISFLYNKYKNAIFGFAVESEEEP